MNEEKIISFYPNTLGFGYVVLDNNRDIIDYGISSVSPVSNKKCLKKIQEIISYYQPKSIILENCENSRKSDRVKKLIKEIANYGKYSIKTFKYSRVQIRTVFEVFGARNKYEISKKISENFPELKNKLPEKRKIWNPEGYYQAIFDSLSLVYTHFYLTD